MPEEVWLAIDEIKRLMRLEVDAGKRVNKAERIV
jgi:hypothetical protein